MLGHPLDPFPAELERLETRRPVPVSRPERRKRTRSQVHWPVCFFGVDARERFETVTENLSSSGFLCFAPVPLILGERMICALRMPSHHTVNNGRAASLECRIRVVRVEPIDGRESYRTACQIEDYRFIESHSDHLVF